MKTAGDYRAEAERLREFAKSVSDPDVLDAIKALIDQIERCARKLENGVG